jgi:hypothetical protein
MELEEYYAVPDGAENGAAELVSAIDAIVVATYPLPKNLPLGREGEIPHRSEPLPSEMVEAMQNFTSENHELVSQLHDALEYDHFRFPIDMNAGTDMELPHLSKLREASRVLYMQAVFAALDGRVDDAADHTAATFKPANALTNEPILISQLVRVAICAIGVMNVEQVLNRAELNSAGLERVQNALLETEAETAFELAFVGERCLWDFAARLEVKPKSQLPYFDLPFVLRDLDGKRFYLFFELAIPAAQSPVEEQLAGVDRLNTFLARNPYGTLTLPLLPAFSRSLNANIRNHALLRIAIVGVAAERFHVEHSEYPETADALSPKFLEALPLDPYDGRAIRYRRLENGFVAYSIGPDLEDDNGVESETMREALDAGDLTFTVERLN